MSQKKVDYYKEQKANRSKIIRKEKRILLLEKVIASLIGIGLVVWVGFSVYNKANDISEASREVVTTQINVAALDSYDPDPEAAEAEAADEEPAADEELTAEEPAEESSEAAEAADTAVAATEAAADAQTEADEAVPAGEAAQEVTTAE